MRKLAMVALVLSTVIPAVVLLRSEALSKCTVAERIDLGKQGYTKDQVEEVCSSSNSDGDGGGASEFWNQFFGEVGKGLAKELTQALTGGDSNGGGASPPPSTSRATMCVTNVGTCPLPAGPVGSSCYCTAWNGYAYPGTSR